MPRSSAWNGEWLFPSFDRRPGDSLGAASQKKPMRKGDDMREIGVALIGTGFITRVHIEALKRIGVTIRGILGISPDESQQAADQMQLARAYTSYDEVLQDPNVLAVHICTPNRLHLPMAKQAILAGKHVICEKPLAMTAEESGELVALARANPHLATATCYNNRYYPLCHEARTLIRSGEMGRVFHVTGSVTQDWLLWDTDYNWRVLAEEGGDLRALSDIGSHWLDLIHFLSGLEIEAVFADYVTVHPTRYRPLGEVETFTNTQRAETAREAIPITTDDYGALLLRFAGGARGCMFVSQVSAGRKYCVRFEIAGQNCSLFWDSQEAENLWVGRRDVPSFAFKRDPALMRPEASAISDYPAGHNEGYPDTFKMLFRDFYKTVATGDFSAPRPYPTFEDGHRDIVLMDAIRASQKSGTWVTLAG
jgi:predicted dehydrogenase